MADFPSARPSLGLFFGCIAPRLAPRFYSISSGASAHPRSVHVTCAVVRDVMPTGRVHDGVASSYLQHCKPGERVPVFVRRSTFKLPADASAPVIMVGPGTGLAPFRGFLQERAAALRAGGGAANGHAHANGNGLANGHANGAGAGGLGPAVLFFGCRNRAHDFIYEDELAGAQECGALTTLHVAFSRAGPAKDYVQHRMEAAAPELWALLQHPKAAVYVCGDAKAMAKDVHRALLGIATSQGGMSGSQAEGWLKALSDKGRYHKDVW